MNFIRLIPVFFSFLLISAHFQRARYSLVALVCLAAPGLLYFTRPGSVCIVQVLLLLAAAEWLRTLWSLVRLRQELGMDWLQLALILGAVAFFTAALALVFRHRGLRSAYQLR